ncbi:TetR/AcrR family transcriptional regulator [Cryptosporangium minutisporangium]|uniref:HTH tetR-type domain-containing protein n=1 Tax=Cryptosporangium minutisporangium TaxID=113569 RepID=A0ABP6SWZ5_9ACTN
MPRQRTLSPTVITAAALQVGDRDGPKAMSMRRIAAELGCDPMALYRHFGDREALLDAVADQALADVVEPDADAPWDVRLREVLDGIRAAALRHPGIAAHIASRPPLGANGQRLGAAVLTALADAGLPPADVVRASQALVAYLAAALAMAVRAGERDPRWHQAARAVDALDAAGVDLPVVGSADQFEYGLRLLLAGIKAEAATKSGGHSANGAGEPG